MKITKLIPQGYCKGVYNAIKVTLETRNKYPNEKIYILGLIIHNKLIKNELEKLNIISLYSKEKTRMELIDEINEGIIILTAHGTDLELINKIKEKNLKLIDTTCNFVSSTYELIKNELNNNHEVIYIGIHNHPEATATISINKDKVHLIQTIDEVKELNLKDESPLITNQTTLSKYQIENITNEIKKYYPNSRLSNEQCNATRLRQDAIINFKENYDMHDFKFSLTESKYKKLNETAYKMWTENFETLEKIMDKGLTYDEYETLFLYYKVYTNDAEFINHNMEEYSDFHIFQLTYMELLRDYGFRAYEEFETFSGIQLKDDGTYNYSDVFKGALYTLPFFADCTDEEMETFLNENAVLMDNNTGEFVYGYLAPFSEMYVLHDSGIEEEPEEVADAEITDEEVNEYFEEEPEQEEEREPEVQEPVKQEEQPKQEEPQPEPTPEPTPQPESGSGDNSFWDAPVDDGWTGEDSWGVDSDDIWGGDVEIPEGATITTP